MAILRVIGLYEALWLAPDGLHYPGPRVAHTDVASAAAARFDSLAVLVVYDGVDPERSRAATAWFHGFEGGQGAAEKTPCLGHPPCVDDRSLPLAHRVVVPAPDLRLNGLADRAHQFEVVVVLGWLVVAELAQHPDCRWGSVENIDPEAFGDPPGASRVRAGRCSLVEHARGPEGERPVDDIGVTRDPTDVGSAPVGVFGVDVEVVLGSAGDVGEIASRRVLGTLGPPSRAAGVHKEKGCLCGHRHRRYNLAEVVDHDLVHEIIAAFHHR